MLFRSDESVYVDENGMPIEPEPGPRGPEPDVNPDVQVPQQFDQKWIDGVLGREPGTPPTPKPIVPPKPTTTAPKPKPQPADDQAFPRPNQ